MAFETNTVRAKWHISNVKHVDNLYVWSEDWLTLNIHKTHIKNIVNDMII